MIFGVYGQKKNGQQVEFIARDIVDSLTAVSQQDVDVLLVSPNKRVNTDEFILTDPIYLLHAKVYVSNRIKRVKSLHYFDTFNSSAKGADKGVLGIWQEALYKNELLTQYPNLNFRFFSTFNAMLQAADVGEIDAMVSSVDIMNAALNKENLQSAFCLLDLPKLTTRLSSLIDKDNHQLMKIINEGFAQIELKELVHLEERWLSDEKSHYRSLLEKVTLNKEEKDFIAKNNEFTVGVFNSLEPVSFYNKQKVFDGIDRDILNLVSKRTGLNFRYQGFDTWHQLYESMLAGEIDMLASITPTENRKNGVLFTQSYWQTPWVILHPQHLGRKSTLANFYGKQLAIIKGYYLAGFLRDHHPQIILKTVNNRQEGLIALRQEQVDGFVETFSSASQLLKQESLVSLAISVIEGMPTDQSHLGVQKNNL